MPALAAQLDLVALRLAVFAAVLAPCTAFLNGAFAGRMGAFRRICHREPPDRSLYASFRQVAHETPALVPQHPHWYNPRAYVPQAISSRLRPRRSRHRL